MTSIDINIWKSLGRPFGDTLIARLVFPEITKKLYCALDARLQRHLLIPLDSSDNPYFDVNSRGINIVTRELVVQDQALKRYIDIQCLDDAGYAIFDLMGGEIAQGLQTGVLHPDDTVKQVLTKWRRFLGNLPRQILSKNEQIGLFAELWFLAVWLLPQLGPDVIAAWRGPWGSRHDFEWTQRSVEVKATTNVRGRIFEIHGLSQLEHPSHGDLFLFGIRVREEAGSSNSLPILIESCRNQIAGSDQIIDKFENALVQAGYSPLHEDEYRQLNLRVIEDILFEVKDDFPRLTNTTFPNGLHPGIEQINYNVNLNTFNHLVKASTPKQMQFI